MCFPQAKSVIRNVLAHLKTQNLSRRAHGCAKHTENTSLLKNRHRHRDVRATHENIEKLRLSLEHWKLTRWAEFRTWQTKTPGCV